MEKWGCRAGNAPGDEQSRKEPGYSPLELLLTSLAGCSGQVDGASVEKAFALSEERFCPVWVMLKTSVPITAKHWLIAG